MREACSLVELWRSSAGARTDSGVLVTLARVEGSSYRKPGARMLIAATAQAGSISGGCLEDEIIRKAAWMTRQGAALQRYSTLFDDTSEIPYGLGCGGVVDLLLEPLRLPETQALLAALERSLCGERMLAATIPPTDSSPLLRVVWNSAGEVIFASEALLAQSREALTSLARQFEREGSARYREISLAEISLAEVPLAGPEAQRTAWLEVIPPPQRLFIFGAGRDAQPLVRTAHLLGWTVTVADGRPSLTRAEDFPEADAVHTLPQEAAQYGEALRGMGIGPNDAAVLLTHSYVQDRALLPLLLPMGLRYLGLLGARHRSRLLLVEAAEQLGWRAEECLERVHAPVGLNLGGDTPESVALAIVAEMQAVLHGREAMLRTGRDHSLLDAPAQAYVPVMCPLDAAENAHAAGRAGSSAFDASVHRE
jgi:xanthine/CO dehydrogenase XdhC/CoxF family maturation factor